MSALRNADPFGAARDRDPTDDLLVPDLPAGGSHRMSTIEVGCSESEGGWTCAVTVRDGDRTVSQHRVDVARADLTHLAPRETEPTALVNAAFGFLLERESPTSILATFSITEIGRYFPGYEADLRRRVEARE
jgi:hypothetical protein